MMGIKFGANANQNSVSWGELLSLWQELDRDSNFDQLWVSDHFVTGLGSGFAHGACVEGWMALSALAQATSRVRLGVLVSGNTYRHPAVLAKMGTTVDHISGGRLEFGVELIQAGRLGLEMFFHNLYRTRTVKRRAAGEGEKEGAAQGVHVASHVQVLAPALFRGHVVRGAHLLSGTGELRIAPQTPGKAEICYLHCPL